MAKLFNELNVYPKPDGCNGCPLHTVGASFARTDGTGRNGVALIGEALGESEAVAGKPFVGDAGYMLNQILHRGKLKRSDFLIMNVINCHPPNNFLDGAPYEVAAIEHCHQYFADTLKQHPEIKVLVPMGNTPLHKLLGFNGIKNFHGTVHRTELYGGHWVVPTLHPSGILRDGGKQFPTAMFDIQRALEVRSKGWNISPVDYELYPTVEEFERFVAAYEAALAADPDTLLASDIETNYSSEIDEEDLLEKDSSYEIIRISFAFKLNSGITLPFTSQFMPAILRLLGNPRPRQVCFWNGNKFDVPRLRQAGVQVLGTIIDFMDGWHVLRPDLPKSLGYVSPFFTDISAWKHLSNAQPEYYSCVDSDVLLRIALKIRAMMIAEGTWETFLAYWAALDARLRAMSEVGIGIDEAVRMERKTHYENIRDNTAVEIQRLIPQELKPDLKKGGYKGKPGDVRSLIKSGLDPDEAWKQLGYSQVQYADGVRWNKKEPFNHNSSQQLLAYIRSKYGEQDVPRDKKTGKPTTGSEELERLARQKDDQVLHLILDAANADSNITSFIKPWAAGPDGRVHGIFTNNPATPRLASQNPNLQNFPRRDAEASAMRKMIVPGDGWSYLCEADYKSIEAIIVGVLADDPAYVRLAYKGVHAFFAGVKLGLPLSVDMSDSDLDAGIREAKKVASKTLVPGSFMSMYDAAKQTVHGSNYLEGALLLHRTYPELFPTVKIAQEYQDFYFNLFKPITVWQDKTVDFCWNNCYVENPWRIKRWLFAAKKWVYSKRTDKWDLKYGEDAKKAIATSPQGSAGMIMRMALTSDAARELIDQRCLMLTIHDSLVARARDKKHLEWVIEMLKKAMEFSVKELGGLIIPTEFKVGSNWGCMEDIKV